MVSVVIPNYNHAPYLKKRIESVINQTFQDIEVIILDDKSSDGSRDIINQYENHPKISHIVFNEINSGSPFYQWQKAFLLAKGDIIWIAESDDYADLVFLERLMPYFNYSEIGIVYCDSNIVDSEGNIHYDFYKNFKNERFQTHKWNQNYQANGIAEIKSNLLFECTINNMSATLFRKSLVEAINFHQLLQFKYCGDWYFLTQLAKASNIYYVCEALNYFKYGTNNFKVGVKSSLNYYKERSLVRYYLWKNIKMDLNNGEKEVLFKQMGTEMRILLNETIK